MPFDIQNLNPAEKFYLGSNGPNDAEEYVELRLCSGQDLENIDKQTMEKKVEWVHPKKKNGKPDYKRQPHRVEYTTVTNEELRNELIWDFMISDWKLYTPDGEEIPCTKENKLKLMKGSAHFASFIGDCMDKIIENRKTEEEDLEKN